MKRFTWQKCVGIVLLIALGIMFFGLLVMGLWNWIVPGVFSGPQITFGEALGILVLSKILFGGFSGGGKWKHHHCGCGYGHGGSHHWKDKWKEKMAARMANMTPEEKEKFKQKMYRCGWSDESTEVTPEK